MLQSYENGAKRLKWCKNCYEPVILETLFIFRIKLKHQNYDVFHMSQSCNSTVPIASTPIIPASHYAEKQEKEYLKFGKNCPIAFFLYKHSVFWSEALICSRFLQSLFRNMSKLSLFWYLLTQIWPFEKRIWTPQNCFLVLFQNLNAKISHISRAMIINALQKFFLKCTIDEYDHFLCFFGHWI